MSLIKVVEKMRLLDPDIYFGKIVRVYSVDGDITEGTFGGYGFDYDDSGNEYTEFDIETDRGLTIGFEDHEVDRIEIIGEIKP